LTLNLQNFRTSMRRPNSPIPRVYLEDAVLEYPQSGERTRDTESLRRLHCASPLYSESAKQTSPE
jgi:hypothetical protein